MNNPGFDRLSKLIPSPRVHRHHYFGAPAIMMQMQQAKEKMGIEQNLDADATGTNKKSRKLKSYIWAMLLARIYEVLPLPNSVNKSRFGRR